jgi:hypothetical protein
MACVCGNLLTAGIDVLCENNAGGVLEILVADKCNMTDFVEVSEGLINSITMELGSQFYTIETQRLTANFEENETNNFDNGSKYFDQILNLVVARRDVARRNAISQLGAGQKDLIFLVRDSNSTWWAMGFNEGLKLATATGGTGTKKEDLNGFTIQFNGTDSEMMYVVDETIIDSLRVPAV